MTLGEFYIMADGQFRQTGRTTALIKAARSIDGLFIVHSESMKREMLKEYPDTKVETMSTSKLFGNNTPLILDHLVVRELLAENTQELVRLRSEVQQLKFMNKNLEEHIEDINDGE